MNGFVKLRRGLAEHVRSGRMTLTEHGAYTLLLQLADHATGRWRGTQRSFAAVAGISSGMAWKLLTSLERKGYLSWNRGKRSVQISKFFVEKSAEKPVEKAVEILNRLPAPGHPVDQLDHAHDRSIRNRRTLLEKTHLAAPVTTRAAASPTRVIENPKPDRAAMVAVLSAMRQIAFAKSLDDVFRRPAVASRSFSKTTTVRRAGDPSSPRRIGCEREGKSGVGFQSGGFTTGNSNREGKESP